MNATEQTIAIVPCATYHEGIEDAVARALELSGAAVAMRGPPSRVLVKPNLISFVPPDRAIGTHPAVVHAVVRFLQRAGHSVIIGDSHSGAFLWSKKGLERLYGITGMQAVAKDTGCDLNFDIRWERHALPKGKILKRVELLRILAEVDWVVNVPKLKTHVYTGITGAVKNLFGLVPGHFKISYHARFSDIEQFVYALRDIALSIPVRATIMDGVTAMEGDGPTGGTPIDVGVIVAGLDLLALDQVTARFCGLDPLSLPWLGGDPPTIIGPSPEEILPMGLARPATKTQDMGIFANPVIRSVAQRLLKDLFSPAPRMLEERCVRCGVCVEACPVDALRLGEKDDAPHVHKGRCIRCYCCHEACPHNAVSIPRSRLAQWLA